MDNKKILIESLEARIVHLEESLWFQERKLDDLDKLVTELHSQQNMILRQLEQTGKMVVQIRDVLHAQGHNGQEPPPPHYQQL